MRVLVKRVGSRAKRRGYDERRSYWRSITTIIVARLRGRDAESITSKVKSR